MLFYNSTDPLAILLSLLCSRTMELLTTEVLHGYKTSQHCLYQAIKLLRYIEKRHIQESHQNYTCESTRKHPTLQRLYESRLEEITVHCFAGVSRQGCHLFPKQCRSFETDTTANRRKESEHVVRVIYVRATADKRPLYDQPGCSNLG